MTHAAIYARVSTSGQAESGTSLASQLEACRSYARAHALQVIQEVQEDASGALIQRAGLDTVRDLIRDGLAAALVVYDPDRLSRNLGHLMLLVEEVEQAGAALHFVNAPHENTPEGMMLLQMRGMFAQYERVKIQERIRRGKEQTVKQGKVIQTGMPVLFGYDYDPVGRTLVVNDERAPLVRQVFQWYAHDGMSMGEIARRLDSMGVPTRGRSPYWRRGHIRGFLTNPTYIGQWTWNKYRHKRGDPRQGTKHERRKRPSDEWLTIQVPAIISTELWQATQERIRANAYYSPRHAKHTYLLSGLLFCGVCSRRMVGMSSGEYHAYACSLAHRLGPYSPHTCPQKRVRASTVDEAVWGEVCRQVGHAERIIATLKAQEALERAEVKEKADLDTAYLERSKNADTARLSRLLELYLDGALDKDRYKTERETLERKIASTQEEIARRHKERARITSPLQSALALRQFVGDALEGLPDVPTDERVAFLRALPAFRVVAQPDGEAVHVYGLFEDVTLPIPRRKYRRRA